MGMRKRKESDEKQAEIDEIARVRALAPQVAPPTMSQLIEAQIGGHSVDMPVKNPFLTDKIIDDDLNPMLDMQVNEKRKGVNFKKFEKKMADLSASKTLEALNHEDDAPKEVHINDGIRLASTNHSYESIKPKDRGRMGCHDVKANMKKDWNCPWVKKDGSGLKQAIRYIDEPNAPARTSVKHYYSEPKSILGDGKELSREELEAIIKEHGQESRPESRMSQGSRPESRAQKKQQGGMYEQETTMEMQEQQMKREEKTFEQREHKEQRVNFVSDDQETYFREREEDSQAPPDLEPVEVQQGFQLGGMGQFGDQGYEPSADELIDVLKNLETLAAGNPDLYRSIVDQIKGSTQVSFEQNQHNSSSQYYQESSQHNGNSQQYEQEMYEQQVYQQQQQDAEQYQIQMEQQQMQMQ